jgi:hypothetical protein
MTRTDGIAVLAEGRAMLGRLALRHSLTAQQMTLVAHADRTLADGLRAAESLPDGSGHRVVRAASSIVAAQLYRLAYALPDGVERERVIEWNAHLELLARSQGTRQ